MWYILGSNNNYLFQQRRKFRGAARFLCINGERLAVSLVTKRKEDVAELEGRKRK